MVKSISGDDKTQRTRENIMRGQEIAIEQEKLAMERKREERHASENEKRIESEREKLELEKKREENRGKEIDLQALMAQVLMKPLQRCKRILSSQGCNKFEYCGKKFIPGQDCVHYYYFAVVNSICCKQFVFRY